MVGHVGIWSSVPQGFIEGEVIPWLRCLDLAELACADRRARVLLGASFYRERLQGLASDATPACRRPGAPRHQAAVLEVRSLLTPDQRADVDYRLHLAIQEKGPCWSLLKAGALWCGELDGKTPLINSIMSRHVAAARTLLACGADATVVPAAMFETPLILAVVCGSSALVHELASAGASLEDTDYKGDTPLICAVMQGNGAMVQALIEREANLEARDRDGDTPLMCAVVNGRARIIEVLLKAGAEAEAVACAGGDPPLFRAMRHGHINCLEALIRGRADVQVRDHRGESALSYALKQGDTRAAQVLRDAGAR